MSNGYCTEAQVKLCMNTNEVTSWADDAGDGTADSGVIQWCIDTASQQIWSFVQTQYSSVTAMNPVGYTSGTYPVLDLMTAPLAADYLRARQGRKPVDDKHPSLMWARQIAAGIGAIS
ncbi:MAG TPA: hypothetical protein VM223_24435 [Planctomycetota bacterium]|nr:hypothetical protein [Planctomycetota bacterium]